MSLDRFFERFRRDDAHLIENARKAIARTEEIRARVEEQWPEVQHHDDFTAETIRANRLAQKLHRAIGEVR